MLDFFRRIISAITSFFMTIAIFFGLSPAPEPVREGWLLPGISSFESGELGETVYNCGTGLENEILTPAVQPSNMQLIRNTTADDARAYAALLAERGYRKTFENAIDNNLYFGFEKGDRRVYFYHTGATGVTRVIDDCCNTVSLDAFGYTASDPYEPEIPDVPDLPPEEDEPFDPGEAEVHGDTGAGEGADQPVTPGEGPEQPDIPGPQPEVVEIHPGVFQFSFPYYDADHKNSKLYAKNGMLYVILLSDGKICVVDGGAPYQCADQNVAEFMRFVRAITGKKEGEPIDIALWYGTHCHADHINFFYKVLHKHRKEFRLERMLFNYQSNEVIPYSTRVDKWRNLLQKYYPSALFVKCHSGYKFSFPDATFEVLYTHEDAVDAETGLLTATNANDGCAVVRLTLKDKTFLFLGDSNTITQDILLRNFTKPTLHADVVQAAHHMINDLKKLYSAVDPLYAMCPQSKSRAKKVYPAYQTLSKLVTENRMLFADQGVYGFLPEDSGSLSIFYFYVACVAYDNSGL